MGIFSGKIERRRSNVMRGMPGDPALAASLVTILSAHDLEPRGMSWAVVTERRFLLAETGRTAHITSRSDHPAMRKVVRDGADVLLAHEVQSDTVAVTPMRFASDTEAADWVDQVLTAYETATGGRFPADRTEIIQ